MLGKLYICRVSNHLKMNKWKCNQLFPFLVCCEWFLNFQCDGLCVLWSGARFSAVFLLLLAFSLLYFALAYTEIYSSKYSKCLNACHAMAYHTMAWQYWWVVFYMHNSILVHIYNRYLFYLHQNIITLFSWAQNSRSERVGAGRRR